MANSLGKISVLVVAMGACSVLAAQDSKKSSDELLLDMKSLAVDRDTNLLNLGGPRITQGNMRISADQAVTKSTDFNAESEWRFTGHVRIEVDGIVLEADDAVFTFMTNQLSRAELNGNPARVTDLNSGRRKEPVHGSANKLAYDYRGRTLRLLENVSLYKGRSEIQSCDLLYDFNDENLASGSSACGVRFITLPLDKAAPPAPASP